MIRLLFLSHPSSNEPPMSVYLMSHFIEQAHLESRISVASASLTKKVQSICEDGKTTLKNHHIPLPPLRHFPLAWKSYEEYDFILPTDSTQENQLFNTIGGDIDEKIHPLSTYSTIATPIPNPYETKNWEETFQASEMACQGLLKKLVSWIR